MQRFGLSALRTTTGPSVLRALRANPLAGRAFSQSTRTNVLSKKPSPFGPSFFTRNARNFMSDSSPVISRPTDAQKYRKMAITAAQIIGGVAAVQIFMNRETNEAGLSLAEQSYLHDSFMYTGAGLGLTAVASRLMFNSGIAMRIMTMNPWVVMGVGLVGSIGSMMGVYYTPVENAMPKHAFWLAFNACQAATLSPLFFLNPAVLGRAALYTVGVVGALSYVGATAKNDTYLYMGGPLLAGLAVVCLSSFAPMVLPVGMRGLAAMEAVSLYGGLAVFSGFVLYDTQKILQHGRLAAQGVIPRDPMKEAISLELDMINIFIRLVQILSMQSNRK